MSADGARQVLEDFIGLAPNDTAVYRALWSCPLTPSELSTAIGLSETACRASLRRLTALSFVAQVDSAGRHAAMPPDVALALWTTAQEAVLGDRRRELQRVRTLARELSDAQSDSQGPARGDGAVQVIDGAAFVENAVEQVTAAARTELRQMVTAAVPADMTVRGSDGVARRAIYRRDLLDDPEVLQRVERRQLHGELIRVFPSPPTRLVLADDTLALVVTDGEPAEAALLVHRSALLSTLRSTFDWCWDRATEVPTPGAAATWVIGDEHAALLRLLAAGLKDRAIARHLGIGLRTVVRRIGNLSRTLDAETRFQAGVQAAKRGLL